MELGLISLVSANCLRRADNERPATISTSLMSFRHGIFDRPCLCCGPVCVKRSRNLRCCAQQQRSHNDSRHSGAWLFVLFRVWSRNNWVCLYCYGSGPAQKTLSVCPKSFWLSQSRRKAESIVSVQSTAIRLPIICRIAIGGCIARTSQFLARLTMSDSAP